MLHNKEGFFGKREESKVRKDVGTVYGVSTPAGSSPAASGSSSLTGSPTSSESPRPEPKPEPAAPKVVEIPSGTKLIVGPDIKLKGEINDCHTIIVEGRVEATTDSKVLQIAESGSYTGTVGIDVAEIRGKFQGELTAREKLVIFATGTVTGKIRYGKIVIEEGGELNGDVSSLAAAKSLTSSTRGSERETGDIWGESDKTMSKAANA
jgi:cytoskeletal protein CcmA (bactofilin family)